jgi:uncharacterized protein with PIN domain
LYKQFKVTYRTYRCPECNEVVLRIPLTSPVPSEEEVVVCPNGHKVTVPKYREKAAI